MSTYVALLNSIREQCDVDWLTDSQAAIFHQLTKGFHHHRVLNVYGSPGTGKTVLAWVLARSGYGVYMASREPVLPAARRLVIDEFPSSSRLARLLIDDMNSAGVQQAVVLTLRPLDEVTSFELELSQEDMARCRANLYQKFDVIFSETTESANLHDLLRSISE